MFWNSVVDSRQKQMVTALALTCVGFESAAGRRSDGLKSDKHRDRHDFGDVGGKLTASDEDDDRHRSSRGSRHSHKTSAAQQGNCLSSSLLIGSSKSIGSRNRKIHQETRKS